MKHISFTLFVLPISIDFVISQESLTVKKNHYSVTGALLHSKKVHGFLTSLNDSSLTCSSTRKRFSFAPGNNKKGTVFSYTEIDKQNIHFGYDAAQMLSNDPASVGLQKPQHREKA